MSKSWHTPPTTILPYPPRYTSTMNLVPMWASISSVWSRKSLCWEALLGALLPYLCPKCAEQEKNPLLSLLHLGIPELCYLPG
jgi:hypothetical protein